MKDPIGSVLVLIRDDPAVAAIVGTKVSTIIDAGGPPFVQIIDNSATRRPFGSGSGRLGLQLALMFARCYGADTPAGGRQAKQLAGAVSDALHLRGSYLGSTFLLRSYAADIDGINRDPETKWPFYDVRLEVYAAAQAVA